VHTGNCFDAGPTSVSKTLAADNDRHLRVQPADRVGDFEQPFQVAVDGQRQADHLRSPARHQRQNVALRCVGAEKIAAPAVQLEDVGDHSGADLVMFVGRAGDQCRAAGGRSIEEVGVAQVEQTLGNRRSQMFVGHRGATALPEHAHIVERALNEVLVERADSPAGVEPGLDLGAAVGDIADQESVQKASVAGLAGESVARVGGAGIRRHAHRLSRIALDGAITWSPAGFGEQGIDLALELQHPAFAVAGHRVPTA
jgi:hypothetical protein